MSLIKLFQGLDKTVLRTQCLVQSEYRQVWIKQSLLRTDGLSLLSQLLVEWSRACHLHLQVLSPSLVFAAGAKLKLPVALKKQTNPGG